MCMRIYVVIATSAYAPIAITVCAHTQGRDGSNHARPVTSTMMISINRRVSVN